MKTEQEIELKIKRLSDELRKPMEPVTRVAYASHLQALKWVLK